MSDLPDLEVILSKIEDDVTNLRWAHQRAHLFTQAAEQFESKGDNKSVQKMSWEILLFKFETINKRKGEQFAPRAHIKEFSEEQINYYKERAEVSKNPIMSSRYSDIVWELEGNYLFAKLAIDGYLESVPLYVNNGWYREVADSYTRAVDLSLRINDLYSVEKVKNQLLETLQKLADNKEYRYCLEITDAIFNMNKYCSYEELKFVSKIIQEGILYYKNTVKDSFHLQRSFLEKLVSLKKAINKTEESSNHRLEIARSYEEEAEWKLHNYPNGPGLSAFFLQEAIKSYSEIGDSEKIKELKIKLKNRTTESMAYMKIISVPVELPQKAIQEFLEPILSIDLNDALKKMADDDRLVPSIEIIRSQTEEQKKIAPLGFLISRVSIRDYNPVLSSSSEEDIFDDHVRQNIARFYHISSEIMNIAIESLKEEKGLDVDSIISLLRSSELFSDEQIDLIQVGLERYFEGDYVSSIHVLIPRLEAALRRLLGLLGEPTTTIREGRVQERTLEDILRQQIIQNFLGENIWNYFKVFLIDKIGDNMRNDVAHGLITKERCTKNIATITLHLLMILTRFSF